MKSYELKKELCRLCVEIRRYKADIKKNGRLGVFMDGMSMSQIQHKLNRLRYEARHRHIAYCMLAGKKYEQIEIKCNVPPNMHFVEKLIKEYEQKTLCCSSF